MKKTFLTLGISLWCALFAFGQSLDPRIAPTQMPLSLVEEVKMAALDNEQLVEAELERRGPGVAPKFAYTFEVDITTSTHGLWEVLDNGMSVWRLRVKSDDAYSLNYGFTEFQLPEQGSLILYSPSMKHIMGPFTPADNEEHMQLWTPIFDGDETVIEVQIPTEHKAALKLKLQYINHDFIGFSQVISGSCNLDVICGAEDGYAIVDQYRDIIQSVAVYGFNGNTSCTGFLINTTRNDCTPYFMTAAHCGVGQNNAPSMVVYWNYQNSTCREPGSGASGGLGDGTLSDFNTGSIFRASYNPSDFALVELDDPVSETANAFFAGWDAREVAPKDTVIAIHHPSTDEKRISFEFDPTYPGDWGQGATEVPGGDHLVVPDWDIGTTEGGSSGSPLFDNQKRVVGQLHGGAAACSNDAYDSYGWVAASWEGGGSPNTRLRDWLDPDNTGALFLDGRSQVACSFFIEPSVTEQSACAPDSIFFTIEVSSNFIDSVNWSIEDLPMGADATFANELTAPGETNELVISNTSNIPAGIYTIIVIGSDGTDMASSELVITIAGSIPSDVALVTPEDGAENQSLAPIFEWGALAAGTSYGFQLASDADFTMVLSETDNLTNNSISSIPLDPNTTYYWRVRARNTCGEAEWGAPFSFTTAALFCSRNDYEGGIIDISSDNPSIITSTIEITTPGLVADLSVLDLDIAHSWVGDLIIRLIAPSGESAILLDRPGVPASQFGCNGDNLLLTFSDNAANTADELESSCDDLPALSGSFQAIDPLAVFIGEPAAGTWTIEVEDVFDQDGGFLTSWGLDICATFPEEASVTALETAFEICAEESINFDVLIGGGFDSENLEITLEGLPNGATASITPEPVQASSIITVSLQDLTEAGTYDVMVNATDGNETSQTSVQLVITGLPMAAALQTPADEAQDIPLNTILSWADAMGATSYRVRLATDLAFSENVQEFDGLTNANTSIDDLSYGTTYYWQVIGMNECGETESTIFSFTTIPDLTFSSSNSDFENCIGNAFTTSLTVGAGFEAPANINYQITPDIPDLVVSYSIDPTMVNPGDVVDLEVSNFEAGDYTLDFTINDGENEVTISIPIEIAPLAQGNPDNLDPPAGEIVGSFPTLSWEEIEFAEDYEVQVFTDPEMTDLFTEGTVNTNEITFSFPNDPEPGFYYWSVAASNFCGPANDTLTNSFFELQTTAVNQIAGQRVSIVPNPTKNHCLLQLEGVLSEDLIIETFQINGQQISRQVLVSGAQQATIDLSNYTSGVYLIRLTHQAASSSMRVIKH